jgi:hypothetical protein
MAGLLAIRIFVTRLSEIFESPLQQQSGGSLISGLCLVSQNVEQSPQFTLIEDVHDGSATFHLSRIDIN